MNKDAVKKVSLWLITGLILVGLMVVIGGITRLTDSGLSMVDWKLIKGAIPPINKVEWNEAFNKYKKLICAKMSPCKIVSTCKIVFVQN